MDMDRIAKANQEVISDEASNRVAAFDTNGAHLFTLRLETPAPASPLVYLTMGQVAMSPGAKFTLNGLTWTTEPPPTTSFRLPDTFDTADVTLDANMVVSARTFGKNEVVVLNPHSPLGRLLMGQKAGDKVKLQPGPRAPRQLITKVA